MFKEILKQLNNPKLCVEFAIKCSEWALPTFENKFPGDHTAIDTINSAKEMINNKNKYKFHSIKCDPFEVVLSGDQDLICALFGAYSAYSAGYAAYFLNNNMYDDDCLYSECATAADHARFCDPSLKDDIEKYLLELEGK